MKISIKKDGEWYLAQVEWYANLFAFWYTKQEASQELLNVVEMMMDYHLELIEKERSIRNHLIGSKKIKHAI